MPPTAGDILVYNGSEWNNQKTIPASLTVDSPTFFVDATNHRVGIGTTAPKSKLDVEGNAVIGATYSGTTAAPTNGLLIEGNAGIGTTNTNGGRLARIMHEG